MSRLQLALNVEDLDAAVDFYTTLFATAPAKRRPGYANFAIENPPLKLVLFEGAGAPGSINHLGVEVQSTDEVRVAAERLGDAGLEVEVEERVDCCYAVQDKVWATSPDGARWETYVVLADSSDHAETTDLCCGGDGTNVVLLNTPSAP
ncbi:MAG: VOC family protein [Acidobacteriota bacterium]|nr:VOC family protein [Acidobacteriota bacterium]MDE3044525.1 VOC family protein [Acidobacteriota bacterium]MDE3221950.1 VOC family protein [Acidobacteriota bacterium]